MNTWYSITRIMQWINELGYKFICPIRSNRQILDRFTDPEKPIYKAVKELPWNKFEQNDVQLFLFIFNGLLMVLNGLEADRFLANFKFYDTRDYSF